MKSGHRSAVPGIVYLSGNRWEDTQGTDQRLAGAIGKLVPVLWVDPPLPLHLAVRKDCGSVRSAPFDIGAVATGVTRLRTLFLPGFTRAVMSPAVHWLLGRSVRAALKTLHYEPLAIVNTSPTVVFPTGIAGTKVMYVTDDWVSGAPMMGLSKGFVQKTLKQNLRHADIVASVSPYLSEKLRTSHGRSMAPRVLPNGCDLPEPRERLARSQNAGVIGTLNERLDMSLLEAVRDSGTAMVMIGPRADRDPEFSRRLDTFLGSENVTWLGQLPAAELPAHLARLGVGLTPYRDDDFNRASFPLKTLEYLAAGLPVVASDLPAVRWLNTESVAIAAGPAEFVEKVQEALGRAFDPLPEESRRAFAGRHTWQARAAGLLAMIEGARQ